MKTIYQKIYEIVRQIPEGRVSSYGRIARMIPNCTPRMVGYAMAALQKDSDVPWHRVVNFQGKISPRSSGDHDLLQEQLLRAEGIRFDTQGRIDLATFIWPAL